MESFRSKRSVYSLDQTQTTRLDAASKIDMTELRKTLPPEKILKEGRKYLVRKSKKTAPYWEFFIEYLDDAWKLRAEYMYGKEAMQLANDEKTYFAYSLSDEYQKMYSSLVPQSAQSGDSMLMDLEDDGFGGDVEYMKSLKDRAKRLKRSGGYVRSEFERYINEQLGVEEEDMDALSWCGINGHCYSIVSRMARDILAIPLSTVSSKSTFSAGGLLLDPFRSSLTPKTVTSPVSLLTAGPKPG